MRKYDKRNKIYMLIVMVSSVILIVIFSFFIKKVITNGSLVYTIDAGSIMYDNDKNVLKTDEDATLKIKWNDMYYLMYKEEMHSLGKNAIIYNTMKSQMNLYGKYYEVTSLGEDKVIIHEDETIVNTNEPKFFKIDDRKYLIIANSIWTENRDINTGNYLIVELDKKGNAVIYNNSVNLKTIEEITIITSAFEFIVAEERLIIDNEEVNLKKIIGSSNEYVKAEDVEDEEEKEQDNNNEATDNANGTGGNNPTTGNNNGTNQGVGTNGDGTAGGNSNAPGDTTENSNGNGTGEGSGGANDGSGGSGSGGSGGSGGFNEPEKDENELTKEEIDNLIQTTKTTSIVSIKPSVSNIDINYVVYDPLDKYAQVWVEYKNISNNDNSDYQKIILDKSINNLVIDGLKASAQYSLNFYYSYYDDKGNLVKENFDNEIVEMKTPSISVVINKIVNNTIYYIINIDKDYDISSLSVNLNTTSTLGNNIKDSENYYPNGQKTITGSFDLNAHLKNKEELEEGEIQISDSLSGQLVTITLTDIKMNDTPLNTKVWYNTMIP